MLELKPSTILTNMYFKNYLDNLCLARIRPQPVNINQGTKVYTLV